MKTDDQNNLECLVIEALPNRLFKVRLPDGKEIIAYLAGKMKLHKISVQPGDRVLVLLDPAGGKTTNRIIRRK